MTKKEAFKKALNFEPVHPVPYAVKFTVEAKQRYREFLGRDFDPVAETGSYVVVSHTNNGWEEMQPGHWKDYYGVVWNKTVDKTLGVVDNPPLSQPNFEGYEFPDPNRELPVYQFIKENNKNFPNHFHMLSIGFTLWERAWALAGMEELMMHTMLEPQFVHDLLDKITKYNIGVINKGVSIGGIDCVHFGDDWGSQNGLLISPEQWREFVKPRFKKTCEAVKKHGLLVSHHSCGQVEELIPDMIECGVDVFDPFQPEAMDIWKVFAKYHGKIAFWGGLSVQKTLPHGSKEEVLAEGKKLLNKMGGKGGYIFSPSHSLTGDIPGENIQAFLDLAKKQ